MNAAARRQRCRAFLTESKCVHPASVFDPISARAAEMVGFEFGIFAGSLGGITVLGAPDLPVLTLSEFSHQAHRICRPTKTLPLLVDADAGYGNALNVMRTVDELESAGVALITIEDTIIPSPFGATDTSLAPLSEVVGKLRAAQRARTDPDLIIAARSQAPRRAELHELVERSRAYEEAGVDVLWFSGLKTREQLESVASAVRIPLMSGSVPADMRDLEYLASQRVRICLQGHLSIRASTNAIYETMRLLRGGVAPDALPNLASNELMAELTHETEYATSWREATNRAEKPDFLG